MLRGSAAQQLREPAEDWLDEDEEDEEEDEPLDSQQQQAIIEHFWHDKQQQDAYWKGILWLVSAALLLLVTSLWAFPFYSPLHSAFTLQLSAAFPSLPSFILPLLLLLSVLTTASLPLLFDSSAAPHPSHFTSALPFRVSAVTLLPVVGLALLTSLSTHRPSFIALLPFTLTTLHFLLSTYALQTSHRLAQTLHQLMKLQYTYHSLSIPRHLHNHLFTTLRLSTPPLPQS